MNERRVFRRVPFEATTEVDLSGETFEASLVDISLRGALLELPEGITAGMGAACTVRVHLSLSTIRIPFHGEIVHARDRLIGIRFTRINLRSMIHLRRLLELNTGDPQEVRRELDFLTDPDGSHS